MRAGWGYPAHAASALTSVASAWVLEPGPLQRVGRNGEAQEVRLAAPVDRGAVLLAIRSTLARSWHDDSRCCTLGKPDQRRPLRERGDRLLSVLAGWKDEQRLPFGPRLEV